MKFLDELSLKALISFLQTQEFVLSNSNKTFLIPVEHSAPLFACAE